MFIANSTDQNSSSDILDETAKTDDYVFALIITVLSIIGVSGNILCIVIFTRGTLKPPGVRLLKYLAVADCITLVLCYVELTLNDVSFDINTTSLFYKKLRPIVSPLNWTMRIFETNLTVLISLQRALAIMKPMTFQKYNYNDRTVNRALSSITVVAVLFSLPNWIVCGPQLYFDPPVLLLSVFRGSFLYSIVYLNYFVFVVHCLIPMLILTICNISFILARRKMAIVLGASRDKGSDRMTAIIGAITSVSVITHVALGTEIWFPQIANIHAIVGVFVILKLSTNFIFYSLFGRTFRKTLKEIIYRGVELQSITSTVATSA